MSNRCEQLRVQALKDGLNSKSGMAWRVHCKSCDSCRTDFFIIETLHHQTVEDQHHLPSSQVAGLLREVKVQGNRNRRRRVLHVAANVVIGLFLVLSVAAAISVNNGGGSTSSALAFNPLCNPLRQHETVDPAQAKSSFFSVFPFSLIPTQSPPANVPSADSIERELDQLRHKVDSRREELLLLCTDTPTETDWLSSGFPGI